LSPRLPGRNMASMAATVVISSASLSRNACARSWLEARAPAEEVLIVGATLDAANELVRIVARTKGAAFGYHRMTLGQLAATLARPAMAERNAVPLGRMGVEAVANLAVHKLARRGALGRYANLANGPGFSRAIANVATELRLEQIAPDALAGVVADVGPLLQAYEEELADHGLTDWSGVLQFAAAAAADNRCRHRLVGLPTLLLDVPVPTASELGLVRALCARAPEMLVTAPANDSITLTRLQTGLETEIVDLDSHPVPIDKRGSLARLQHHLFTEHAPTAEAELDDEVVIFSAPGESRECVEIARRVLALARGGVAFDRIAVLLRSPEEYRAHLEEAFTRAGVPVHFARGSVRPDPAGRAFHALLCCAAENLSARRFAEYLSLGQVPDAKPDGTPPETSPRSERWVAPDQELIPRAVANALTDQTPLIAVLPPSGADQAPVIAGQLRAPRCWERLLVEAAVIGGRARWRRRIDGLAAELRSGLAEIGEDDEARAAVLRRTLEDLEALAVYSLPLIETLDALPKSAKWGDWLDHLSGLATRALRQPNRVLSVLSELAPMAVVGPVTLNDVLMVVSDLLLEVGVPPLPQRYGRVFVGPAEAARGMSFEAVFVPGLAEKLFPRKIVEEPILLDAVRAQLNAGLPTNVERLARERLALSLAVGAAERRLYLSYPRLDLEQARPRVPSFYALEAVRATEGRLPNFAELDRRAEAVTSARVGWPAPADPAEAIDHAEHDLAILDHLLALDPDAAGGTARYLLTANPYLSRALRTRWQKWSPRWTPADGLIMPSVASRAAIAKHALGARSYSPTALQAYAACPYRFFLQAIQRLAPREVPEAIDDLDPLQRGSLIHDIQFELFERLRAAKLLPVRRQDLDRARNMLDEIVEEVADRYYSDLAPAIDRVWVDGIAAIRADLREWLRRASEDDSGYMPWRFELSFGLAGRDIARPADSHSVPDAIDLDCGIQLRGSIDLLERHPSGHLRVTDHKTGKPQGKDGQIVAGGTSLQPALYALAAEKLFGQEYKVDCGRLYFCSSTGGFSELIVKLDAPTRDAVAAVAEIIGQAIEQPFLPAAPAERQCGWCDYRSVCGPYEELRTRRKPKNALAPLLALRGMP
jgi:ATP-dependent helicase/nuclease subunit B